MLSLMSILEMRSRTQPGNKSRRYFRRNRARVLGSYLLASVLTAPFPVSALLS